MVQRVSAVKSLLASCTVAIAADDQDHAIDIPEAMVFDLVHGLGVESDLAIDLDDDSELLVMPQLHYELSEYLEIQLGAGAEFTADDAEFSAGFQFIYAR